MGQELTNSILKPLSLWVWCLMVSKNLRTQMITTQPQYGRNERDLSQPSFKTKRVTSSFGAMNGALTTQSKRISLPSLSTTSSFTFKTSGHPNRKPKESSKFTFDLGIKEFSLPNVCPCWFSRNYLTLNSDVALSRKYIREGNPSRCSQSVKAGKAFPKS